MSAKNHMAPKMMRRHDGVAVQTGVRRVVNSARRSPGTSGEKHNGVRTIRLRISSLFQWDTNEAKGKFALSDRSSSLLLSTF